MEESRKLVITYNYDIDKLVLSLHMELEHNVTHDFQIVAPIPLQSSCTMLSRANPCRLKSDEYF